MYCCCFGTCKLQPGGPRHCTGGQTATGVIVEAPELELAKLMSVVGCATAPISHGAMAVAFAPLHHGYGVPRTTCTTCGAAPVMMRLSVGEASAVIALPVALCCS